MRWNLLCPCVVGFVTITVPLELVVTWTGAEDTRDGVDGAEGDAAVVGAAPTEAALGVNGIADAVVGNGVAETSPPIVVPAVDGVADIPVLDAVTLPLVTVLSVVGAAAPLVPPMIASCSGVAPLAIAASRNAVVAAARSPAPLTIAGVAGELIEELTVRCGFARAAEF